MRAERVSPGDTVGIVSPSWGGAGRFPHRVDRGVEQLRSLGFRVRMGRHALNQHGFVSDTAEHRTADIHEMFRDPDVKLILAATGGDHSCDLLPLLDFELIREHPTLFMGFSDITVLNVAIWMETGLVTFDGPALLSDFAEYPRMFEYTRRWFLRAVSEPELPWDLTPSAWWTEEFLDWSEKLDLTRPRRRIESEGWTWLGRDRAEGVLIGGCLESLQHLRGTRFWPAFDGAILFLETSEAVPTPEKVDGILMDYENMGVLDRIHGLLFGRPMRYTEDQRRLLREVVRRRTDPHGFPVVMDMDFGHTAPRLTIPIGCRARIDSVAESVEVLEPAVTRRRSVHP